MTEPRIGGPLSGLRVIELTSYVATPLCGLVLRQLGADVIRIEPIGGAPDRTRMPRAQDGTSLYWAGLNGGKRAIAVDLRRPEGQDLVADLICGAGPTEDPGGALVIANGDRHRALSYQVLRQRRPDLVHVLLTGTRDGRNAVDYLIQASTGFAALNGPKGAEVPTNTVVPAWDVAAGLYLATGLLAAVHQRLATGVGQRIELSLEDVAFVIAGAIGYLAEAQLHGIDRGPSGNEVYGTFGRDFLTADGARLMVVVLTTGHWRRLVTATDLTDVFAAIETSLGADFADEAQRYRHRAVIAGLLEPWFAQRTGEEIHEALATTGVLLAPYRSFNDLVADDAATLRSNPLFDTVDQPGVGRYLAPGCPLVLDGRQIGPAPAPAIGADTDDVLTSLGIDRTRLAELREDGCIA